MVEELTLEELLTTAIEKEIQSQYLYADLGRRVKDQSAKDALDEIIRQEKGHETRLEQYLRGEFHEGALCPGDVIDYKIAEKLDQPEITPDMNLKDVFLLAAKREKASHEFYLGLAAAHPAGQVKSLLEDLACQELEHKQRVEYIYDEVAFPQTDGG